MDEAPAAPSKERSAETPHLRLRAPVLYPTGEAGHHAERNGKTGETWRSPTVTTTLQHLAAQAAHAPAWVLTTLAHRIEVDRLHEAYRHTSQSSAAGIDGVTATQEAEHLEEHRRDLHERLRSGRDQAGPVVRVGSEKAEGGPHPSGTPACEDTMVQRAVAMRREAIDEQDFDDGSYGCRPGRSPHQAWPALRERGRQEGIGGIVEADVRGDCDSLDRPRLREVLRQRVNEGRRGRLLGKWLRAGVREDGGLHHPETGVVQGGVISPVRATVFLQQVREEWCEREVRPRRKGRAVLLRLAADVCIGGEREADARQIMAGLPKRCARSGFTIHPAKTAWSAFGQPDARQASAKGNGTCEFLGLTHYWAQSRRGFWGRKRRTASKRLRRTKKAWWRWCRPHRHAPLKYQYQMLGLKLCGHCRYDGIRGNFRLLEEGRRYAEKAWRYWRSRRSSKRAIGGEQCQQRLETYVLPTPKIVHTI